MFKRLIFSACLLLFTASQGLLAKVLVKKLNPTIVEVRVDNQLLTLDFYGPDIVRLFLDPQGGIIRNPEAQPPAQILVDQPRRDVGTLTLAAPDGASTHFYRIATEHMVLSVDEQTGAISVSNHVAGKVVTTLTPSFDEKGFATLTLKARGDEYFYGGGVQNGRFSHKGQVIAIENTNNWVDGGVASPTPFYWSTAGYGILWHTFRPGKYDFGASGRLPERGRGCSVFGEECRRFSLTPPHGGGRERGLAYVWPSPMMQRFGSMSA
ncbi:MAG: hypothetical protein K6A32_00340 [Bacteroidales bacterium]|nr:hypothetical protein [Bacteroidales bacterium]